jgi:hypothetical protein
MEEFRGAFDADAPVAFFPRYGGNTFDRRAPPRRHAVIGIKHPARYGGKRLVRDQRDDRGAVPEVHR